MAKTGQLNYEIGGYSSTWESGYYHLPYFVYILRAKNMGHRRAASNEERIPIKALKDSGFNITAI